MLRPIVMCGGAGARLWPLSRPDRPKPFVPLVGGRSTLALTLARLRRFDRAAAPVVVAGPEHVALVRAELGAAGLDGVIVVEPEARDSAPAMAAAAWQVLDDTPDGICLFLAADHHIPDARAFAEAATIAAARAAAGGIVTFGVRPDRPATEYGYIRPGDRDIGAGMRPVLSFVEKPDAARAAGFVSDGYLWNSGIFVARAATLLDELRLHQPVIVDHTRDALDAAERAGGLVRLGEPFRRAPRISIDHALMERTREAMVLPVGFEWSDLGAWPAILKALGPDSAGNATGGRVVLDQASGVLALAGEGMTIAVSGLQDVAVVADHGHVMVSAMSSAGGVKPLVERACSLSRAAPCDAPASPGYAGRKPTGETTMTEPTGAEDLNRTLGLVRRVEMDPAGRAVLEYEAGLHMCHSGGVVQGGFVTGWIDAAMAHAAIAMAGADIVPMSLELKVSFFAPARPGRVIAEAWVERRGKRTCFFEGRLLDPAGVVLAKASSTLMLAARDRVETASKAAGGS